MKSAAWTRAMRGPNDMAPGNYSQGGAFGQSGYVAGFGNFEPQSMEEQRTRLQQRAGKYDPPHEDDDLGENDWTVTYTDMVTLLMAFFVILTAIAISTSKAHDGTVTQPHPEVYGTGPSTPFDGHGFTLAEVGMPANRDPVDLRYDDPDTTTPSTTDPSPSGTAMAGSASSGNPTPLQSTPAPQPPRDAALDTVVPQPAQPQQSQAQSQPNQLAQQLQSMVNQNSLAGQVEVISAGDSVTLRISDKILFSSGKADLENSGQDLVKNLSAILAKSGGVISIEGHTDNLPISTSAYASNWELSAARATMVLRQLVSLGLPANRLRAIAYADTKPVKDNSSPDGRAANRRVELVISSAP